MKFISLYGPQYPTTLTYMLQSAEYQAGPYLRWFWRTTDFAKVMHRRTLNHTKAARLLLLALRLGMLLQVVLGVLLAVFGRHSLWLVVGVILVVSYPLVWAYLVVIPLEAGRLLIVRPKEQRHVAASEAIFAKHPAIKIAIAGSYGKTSMKELLVTVLDRGKRVAYTPANKNVAISHAYFARKLKGDEDILIIEYGEGRPGDVAQFAKTTHPTHAVITGLAPAHLDMYKTLRAAGEDIFSIADYLQGKNVFVNGESEAAIPFIKESFHTYSVDGALGWKVGNVKLDINGTSFDITKGTKTIHLTSKLLGKHQIGPLTLAAGLGFQLGLSEPQVIEGIAATKPYEHRMQPYPLNGAWVIDDTYNGNIEGIRAGTRLLAALSARRKIYVTPGLVDQGEESAPVHQEMGRLIATAKPDIVVLMQDSATDDIKKGLAEAGFGGKIAIETDPLLFYENLSHFVATGDLVLMQNDWTDNYA